MVVMEVVLRVLCRLELLVWLVSASMVACAMSIALTIALSQTVQEFAMLCVHSHIAGGSAPNEAYGSYTTIATDAASLVRANPYLVLDVTQLLVSVLCAALLAWYIVITVHDYEQGFHDQIVQTGSCAWF